MDERQKNKAGDVLCDVGKYMLTAVPLSYFLSDKPGSAYVIFGTAVFGFLFILFGLYFVKSAELTKQQSKGKKRKIRILKNSVFVVEEETKQ
jgi:hypothetical protein